MALGLHDVGTRSAVDALRTELDRADAVARSIDQWLARMVEGLRGHYPIDRATVRIIDPEDGDVVVVGQYSEQPTALTVGTRIPYRSTSFPRVVRERRPLMSDDIEDREHPLPLLEQILWEEGVRSWVSVPLRNEIKTVGLLSFASPEPGAFVDEDRVLFENIGLLCQDVLVALASRRLLQLRS